jgi:hypothetical protein
MLHRLRKLQLALKVGPTVAFYQLGLAFLPFTTLARLSTRASTENGTSSEAARPSPDQIASAVASASIRLPGKATCLARSLATLALLKRHRFDAQLRLGVARDEAREVIAHAWVEVDGVALNERPGEFEPIADVESVIR